jgi:hypothetical protein
MQNDTDDERWVGARIKVPLLNVVDLLHEKGFTDTEIVRQGIRLLARKEKVVA